MTFNYVQKHNKCTINYTLMEFKYKNLKRDTFEDI